MKTALVTGGRRGIGRACALALMKAGYKVTVIAKSEDRGDLPKRIRYIQADLIDNFDVTVTPIDVLVNNAGISDGIGGDIFRVNTYFPYVLTYTFAQNGATDIINISSISATKPARGIAAYAASKAALEQMTRCMAIDYGPKVRVNCIAPGLILTDMFHPDEPDKLLERIPAGRFGTPEDVAGVMMFMLSPAAQYITGAVIPVDGGWGLR